MTAETIVQPTPEQRRRVKYEKRQVLTKAGQVVGVAFTRRPWFETLALRSQGEISDDDLRALRLYREAWETTQRSETRCALNRQLGSQGDGATPGVLVAIDRVRLAESGLSARLLATLRAVALLDQRFADVAIDRWGSRSQIWVRVQRADPWIERILPKRKADVDRIQGEFMRGLRRLEINLSPLLKSGFGVDFCDSRVAQVSHSVEVRLQRSGSPDK